VLKLMSGANEEKSGENMKAKLTHMLLAFLGLALLLSNVVAIPAQGQSVTYKLTVLHSFKGGIVDGGRPWGGLVRDAAGNLYGTAFHGGIDGCPGIAGCGIVYKIDSNGKETVLHAFVGPDGGGPMGGLVRDEQGNLYGTTSAGGDPNCFCGAVYKLDPSGRVTVLHVFTDGFPYGYVGPTTGLVRDAEGSLYGTSETSGALNLGNVFKIDSQGRFHELHAFQGWDGTSPYLDPLTLDAEGNLYGVTSYGGASGFGSLFKLDRAGKISVLYSFTGGTDGGFPTGSLVIDKAGDLYGATYQGGGLFPATNLGAGVVFKLEKTGKYSLLKTFKVQGLAGGSDGTYGGGFIRDKAGNLYGTTAWDGAYGGGSVFMVDPTGKFRTLYSFQPGGSGGGPFAPVMQDADGNLYGTTFSGGEFGEGVVFELSPD
jgi:uncharacterized repeat protein (TIGR03803 family)